MLEGASAATTEEVSAVEREVSAEAVSDVTLAVSEDSVAAGSMVGDARSDDSVGAMLEESSALVDGVLVMEASEANSAEVDDAVVSGAIVLWSGLGTSGVRT